ncbi:MAG: gamma-glutamyltransferase [candidate division Zixibacteria bacterium]
MPDSKFPSYSHRVPVTARNIVATSQPRAAQAGINMLKKGGNAVDAVIATAITLTVVEPTSNGIGGDAFAIVWDGKQLHGINGSGRSPKAWIYERFSHLDKTPQRGWDTVTVPGAVSVWAALSEKFGQLPFEQLFEPAIRYATDGFPITPKTARAWKSAATTLNEFPEFYKTFLPHGRAPKVGEIFSCEDQAKTLELIAGTKGESFYRGELAEKIVACSRKDGGLMTFDDLASHKPEWVTPLSQDYQDITLHELPPNGQGLAALIAIGILDRFDLSKYPMDSADSIHLQIEVLKLAFADIKAHLADPEYMKIDPYKFLKHDYLDSRAKLIDLNNASFPKSGIPYDGGTVYLTVADSDGMMVSFIQSNYMGFGSGIVIPGTGISMQNRGCGFTLEKGHPNQVDGGKRPYHTIIPGFVTKKDAPLLSFGVMGGHMQAQGHIQIITRIFDYGQNPQAASDFPRWYITEDSKIAVEPGFSADMLNELTSRGHTIITDLDESTFGGAQLIYKSDDGYIAGSDHRKDGLAIGF